MTCRLQQPQIAKDSKRDKELSIVLKSIQHGHWPTDTTVDLGPFRKRLTELSVLDGCILWGSRVVIPSVVRKSLLQELHTTHLGMSKMKSLARSYIWWPGLDSQIEELCRACVECVAATEPTKGTRSSMDDPSATMAKSSCGSCIF